MSYVRFDHAEWVERNNSAINRQNARKHGYGPQPERLTPFQAKVADIIGMVFGGVYNAPITWERVDWKYGTGVSFALKHRDSLETWDFDRLTRFVFLCHEARIRGEIEGGGFHSLRLSFWPRTNSGTVWSRHPNLDEAVAAFREYLPADHRIIYRDLMPETTGEAA